MATLVQYRARFPEHTAIPDATVEMYLDDANDDVQNGELGDRLTRAQLYYAAHLVATDPTYGATAGGSGGGNVQSRTVGNVSVTFATSPLSASSGTTEDDLKTTSYGRRYLMLLNASLIGFRSIG